MKSTHLPAATFFPRAATACLGIFALSFCAAVNLRVASAQAPDNVLTLKGNLTLQVVDRTGNPIIASVVPEDLRTRLAGIDFGQQGRESSGLVVAKVKLPADEKDLYYSSSLVGKGWYGGMHYLNVGNGANSDVVCIRLGQQAGECRLELKKLNYQPIIIPIPSIDPAGRIIWLGELSPERYAADAVRLLVSGKVVTAEGESINEGRATIRVNGTPATVRRSRRGISLFAISPPATISWNSGWTVIPRRPGGFLSTPTIPS